MKLTFYLSSTILYMVLLWMSSCATTPSIDTDPQFEFCVNGTLLTSDMPIWELKSQDTLLLNNGGIQTTRTFEGLREWEGLMVMIDCQRFDDSPLKRERIRLKSSKKEAFRLTNLNGKNHFIFPKYVFDIGEHNICVEEMRMGSYGMEILPDFNKEYTYDNRPSRNLAGCHMFHTDHLKYELSEDSTVSVKGPFMVANTSAGKIVTSYEHASQDKTYIRRNDNNIKNESIVDLGQGLEEDSLYLPQDDDFWFIASNVSLSAGQCTVWQNIRRGGYLDGETIPCEECWESVWSTIAVIPENQDHFSLIKDYVLTKITDNPQARKPEFYYNTWGMQRDSGSDYEDLRNVFTEKRILEEIESAAELNVDIFVFDDGWQEKIGEWKPNKQKLPNGFAPLIEAVRNKGMTPGVWVALAGVDSTSERYKQHVEWAVRSMDGRRLDVQWGHPAFDIVSEFYDLLLEDHKWLIDQGIRFFKWDGLNTFNSFQPGLGHGSEQYSKKERIDRYNYLMPFYVVKLMRELREYCPDIMIEIDLTEPERAMVGLMPLQEGKFFWMNNGASGYGDYSTLRTKSMRNIINQTNWLLPPEIFTFATYPHNMAPAYAQRYNINTSIIGGYGFWGNLRKMRSADRVKVGSVVAKAKKVIPHVAGKQLEITGLIGATPELYVQKNVDSGYGIISGFSGSAVEYPYTCKMDNKKLLGVLNHAYKCNDEGIHFNFQFTIPDDTREAFMIGNDGSGVTVLSSTGWLDDLTYSNDNLTITSGNESTVVVRIPSDKDVSECTNAQMRRLSDDKVEIKLQARKKAILHFTNR